MFILDTNVISEWMRPRPHASVVAWLVAQSPATLYTTYINSIEVYYGIATMPVGKKRAALAHAANDLFVRDLAGRVLPFDAQAAAVYPDMLAKRRRAGKRMEGFDALIAAIAKVEGATIVTRDVDGFAGCGLKIINPWKS